MRLSRNWPFVAKLTVWSLTGTVRIPRGGYELVKGGKPPTSGASSYLF
jgi:hypothetical protein